MSLLLKISVFVFLSGIMQIKTCAHGGKESLATADYIAWVENPENGCFVTKEISGLVFSLQYKPLEYEVMLQEKSQLGLAEMKLETDSLSDMQYYTFRIGSADGSDVGRYNVQNDNEYYARLEYFALQMQNDLVLIDGQDTLPCRMFHFERTYGIDPRATFVLAFDANGHTPESKTLLYSDRAFETGPVLLTIESSDLAQIPELHLAE